MHRHSPLISPAARGYMKGFWLFLFSSIFSFQKALLSTVAKRKKKLLPSNKKIQCPEQMCVSSVAYQTKNPQLLSRTWCKQDSIKKHCSTGVSGPDCMELSASPRVIQLRI